jgi:hypothetical protein
LITSMGHARSDANGEFSLVQARMQDAEVVATVYATAQ